MAGREDKSVTIRPNRIFGIKPQILLPQQIYDGCHGHRSSGVTGVGLLNSVHTKRSDCIDREGIDAFHKNDIKTEDGAVQNNNRHPPSRDTGWKPVTLELDSIDRLYLNGYVPQLQHGPGLIGFLCRRRGQPIASPALLGQTPENSLLKLRASPRSKPSLCFTLSVRNPKTCVPTKGAGDQRRHRL